MSKKLLTKDQLISKYPFFIFSYPSIEESNNLNLLLRCSIKNFYSLFDAFVFDAFEEEINSAKRFIKEIKINNIPIIIKLNNEYIEVDFLVDFLNNLKEENQFDQEIKLLIPKSDELDKYFEKLENNPSNNLKILEIKYTFDRENSLLLLDKILIMFDEKIEEMNDFFEMEKDLKYRIGKIEKDYKIKIFSSLEKNNSFTNFRINFRRNAETIFDCEDKQIILNEMNIEKFETLYNQYFSDGYKQRLTLKGQKYYNCKDCTITGFDMKIMRNKK